MGKSATEEKFKYIVMGALLINAAPGLLAPVIELANATSVFQFYLWPMQIAASFNIPVPPLVFLISFWTLIGGGIGYIAFALLGPSEQNS